MEKELSPSARKGGDGDRQTDGADADEHDDFAALDAAMASAKKKKSIVALMKSPAILKRFAKAKELMRDAEGEDRATARQDSA